MLNLFLTCPGLERGQVHLGTSVTPYLIYHHTVSIDFIATVQHVRKPTGSVERGGLLGFFEDITGAIWRKSENRRNTVEELILQSTFTLLIEL